MVQSEMSVAKLQFTLLVLRDTLTLFNSSTWKDSGIQLQSDCSGNTGMSSHIASYINSIEDEINARLSNIFGVEMYM